MSEAPPPERPRNPRPRFEPIALGGVAHTGRLWLYAAAVLCFASIALYMGVVERHALTSPYVAAPAIGALWFGLRLFMIFSSRK